MTIILDFSLEPQECRRAKHVAHSGCENHQLYVMSIQCDFFPWVIYSRYILPPFLQRQSSSSQWTRWEYEQHLVSMYQLWRDVSDPTQGTLRSFKWFLRRLPFMGHDVCFIPRWPTPVKRTQTKSSCNYSPATPPPYLMRSLKVLSVILSNPAQWPLPEESTTTSERCLWTTLKEAKWQSSTSLPDAPVLSPDLESSR